MAVSAVTRVSPVTPVTPVTGTHAILLLTEWDRPLPPFPPLPPLHRKASLAEPQLLYDGRTGALIDAHGGAALTGLAASAAFEAAVARSTYGSVSGLRGALDDNGALDLLIELSDGAEAWASAGWLRAPATLP